VGGGRCGVRADHAIADRGNADRHGYDLVEAKPVDDVPASWCRVPPLSEALGDAAHYEVRLEDGTRTDTFLLTD
jgi:hypothetical protein